MITVQLLGGACLRSGDAPLTGPPAQRHRIALLALIAGAWPQPLSRDRAMAMLWPERDVTSARRLLNLAVHVLRSALGEHAIASTGDGLLLNPSCVNCDLHQLRAAIDADATDRVARLYSAPLLDGFHLDDSSEFGYWLDERRSELSHAYVGALLAISERQQQSGDLHGRVRTCLRLVAADPHSGAYAQSLMRALDDAGDRLGALQHASDHARRRRADLDLEPDTAVVSLAERLRAAPAKQTPEAAQGLSTQPSVAVLPFVNLGANEDAENGYFADGLTDDVIAHLSKIRALKVISRTSVAPFRERQQSVREIGWTLGASTLLDGSVRRSGNRVRIVARLVSVQTEQNLWAETYDRQLTDIFAIQTDVALQIAAALQAELTRDEKERLRKQPTKNLQAYQLFLMGREFYIKYNPESYLQAVDRYKRALAHDSGFALAAAQLAMVYVELAEMGTMEPNLAFQLATDAAANALRLDPELGEAYCTTAYLKMVGKFDWVGAEKDFRRALELSPSSADTYSLYGRFCAGLGRYDEALALQQRSHELDPLGQRTDGLTTLLRAGRYDEAVRAAEQAVDLDPDYDRAHTTLGWAYFLTGRQQEGLIHLECAVSVSPANTLWLGQLGQAYALAGDLPKAREALQRLERRAQGAFVSPYHFAYIYTGLGEYDRAMDFLERAVDEKSGPAYSIKGSFLLTALHDHPRFRSLLRRMNLET
jgi:TolB-like protein/Tfp pilus assembly protein PilF